MFKGVPDVFVDFEVLTHRESIQNFAYCENAPWTVAFPPRSEKRDIWLQADSLSSVEQSLDATLKGGEPFATSVTLLANTGICSPHPNGE